MWILFEKIFRKRVYVNSELAMVSFTFDDSPITSFTNGGRILEEHGFRGTYYISADFMGSVVEVGELADLKTITEFHDRGHEIANHTDLHIDCKNSSFFSMARSIRKNRKKLDGIITNNFSYPFGAVDASSRCVARLCTSSARGTWTGINRETIDPMYLKAVRVYNRLGIEKCLDLVSECATQGGWLIFYTHDVSDEPSDYGCTPGQLMELLQAVSCNGLPVLTVQEAMTTILGYANEKFR